MPTLTLSTPMEVRPEMLTDAAIDEVLTSAHAHRSSAPRLMSLLESAMIAERIRRRETPDAAAQVTRLEPATWLAAEIGQSLLIARGMQDVISEETAWMLFDQLETLFVFHAAHRLGDLDTRPVVAPSQHRSMFN